MYKEGLGFRSIGRVLNVSFMTVIKWIKNFALELKKALVNTEVPNEFDIIQIDEIFSYVKKNLKNVSSGLLLIKLDQGLLITKLEIDQQKR